MRSFSAILLAISTFAAATTAQTMPQRFSHTNPNPAPVGETLHIVYENTARANTTITIRIHNGNDSQIGEDIEIHIDSKGRGTYDMPTPAWPNVVLTFQDSADYVVLVPPSGSGGNSQPTREPLPAPAEPLTPPAPSARALD